MTDPNVAYVIAGYVLTVAALGGYLARLRARAVAARRRAEGVAHRRDARSV